MSNGVHPRSQVVLYSSSNGEEGTFGGALFPAHGEVTSFGREIIDKVVSRSLVQAKVPLSLTLCLNLGAPVVKLMPRKGRFGGR